MIRCWREKPEERADFPQLLTALTDHSEENPHSSLIQLNNDDNSSSGSSTTPSVPLPRAHEEAKQCTCVSDWPSQNVLGSQRGSVSGQQMGLESNTLSSKIFDLVSLVLGASKFLDLLSKPGFFKMGLLSWKRNDPFFANWNYFS